ncbi:hypothetical protein [Leptospira mayottensis]|uniref:hypothetical protein n=1 Tax=Leptospira mayottensis TaxID=1137606 RepID=UPI0013C2D334|nr:hypothetical protein [Leptospira mayottensis]
MKEIETKKMRGEISPLGKVAPRIFFSGLGLTEIRRSSTFCARSLISATQRVFGKLNLAHYGSLDI